MTVQDVFIKGIPIMDDVIKKVISTHRNVSMLAESTRDMAENKGKSQRELELPLWNGYHDKFKQAYEDILSTKPILHPEEICTVIYSKDIEGDFYDVSSITVDEFMDKFIYDKPPIKNYEDLMNVPMDVVSYSLMFIPREDLLGYTMSEVSMESYALIDMVSELLWELTWFGYSNEEVEENLRAEQEYLESDYDEDDFTGFDEDLFEDIDHDDDVIVDRKEYPTAIDKGIAVNNRIIIDAYYRKLYEWLSNREE